MKITRNSITAGTKYRCKVDREWERKNRLVDNVARKKCIRRKLIPCAVAFIIVIGIVFLFMNAFSI